MVPAKKRAEKAATVDTERAKMAPVKKRAERERAERAATVDTERAEVVRVRRAAMARAVMEDTERVMEKQVPAKNKAAIARAATVKKESIKVKTIKK